MYPESPWCDFSYTEMAAKTAAFTLFKVYASCLLWSVGRNIFEGIRRLHLNTIMRREGNAAECRRQLDAIEWLRFRDLPSWWSP